MPSCRSHIALVLTAVISLNVLAVPISYLNFRVNQDYYAAVLCENPEKPITVCGGICYLKKQLPAADQSEPPSFVSKIDIAIYYQPIEPWSAAVITVCPIMQAPYSVTFPVPKPAFLFRPPRA